jgi:nucleoid DNA-binding protein
MKTTQKTLTAKIAEQTGLTTYKSRKALKTVLKQITLALGDGKQVDLGKLGKLIVVTRKPGRRIINKLNGYNSKTISDIHKKHPKTVRLLGRGRDLSEDPQPTVITKRSEKPAIQTNVRRSVAIAFPSWRRRIR